MCATILDLDLTFDAVGTPDQPIYRAHQSQYSLFYTPGYLVVVATRHEAQFEQELQNDVSTIAEVQELRRNAQDTATRWNQFKQRTFEPVCLTLYLNNECNLHCRYCYAVPSPQPMRRLDPQIIRQAAAIVASNCRRNNQPFTVVFHGGGEPTLDQQLADATLDIVEQVAVEHNLSISRYVATNGVMSTGRATWMAQHFDLIGLSCDGPPAIQNAQRPLWGGGPTAAAVHRTAHIVRDMGKPLSIRVTLTQDSFNQQADIAHFLCHQLRPQDIHVEPVYEIGRARDGTSSVEDAKAFVSAFLEAEQVAQSYGMRWQMSGSRPQDLHGPYCHLFRNVLQMVPGDGATVCFKMTTVDTARRQGSLIGEVSAEGIFSLDTSRVSALRDVLQHEPDACQTCFNHYHCVRSCPEYCPLETTEHHPGFRCQIQRLLTSTYLQNMAQMLWNQPSRTDIRSSQLPMINQRNV